MSFSYNFPNVIQQLKVLSIIFHEGLAGKKKASHQNISMEILRQ